MGDKADDRSNSKEDRDAAEDAAINSVTEAVVTGEKSIDGAKITEPSGESINVISETTAEVRHWKYVDKIVE